MRKPWVIRMLHHASCIFFFTTSRPRNLPRCRRFASAATTTESSKPQHKLNKEQESILKAVSQKKSVFITGSAGTGKSFIVSKAIEVLKTVHKPNEVFVTASTGVAACALSGQTLHSFAGVGLGQGGKRFLLKKVVKDRRACNRWRRAKALVIDEISMITCGLFESLEFIARTLKTDKPWGGIQLIVSGDFFQLPPIPDRKTKHLSSSKEFAFEADCWDSSFHLQLELTQIFRQFDAELINLLQGIRRGHREEQHLQILQRCPSDPPTSLPVTRLYPRNMDVKKVNEERLRLLGKEIVRYAALDTGKDPWKRQLSLGMAPDQLDICEGARVMLIKNKDLDSGLVNGATGTIVSFVDEKHALSDKPLLPKVRFDSGYETVVGPDKWEATEADRVVATRKQIPLVLAWAVSIHKCQGMTLDHLHTDLSKAFGYGMVYVALSRLRSLAGLYLSGFDSSKIKAHPKVSTFYENLHGN